MTTFAVHFIQLLEDAGLTKGAALFVAVLFGPAQVFGRLFELSFCRNVHPLWMAIAGSALVMAGVMGFSVGSFEVAVMAAVAYGCGNGIITIARGTLPLTVFGTENLGQRMGCIAMPALFAQALAPISTAYLAETTSSETILLVCTVLLLLSISALAALRQRMSPL